MIVEFGCKAFQEYPSYFEKSQCQSLQENDSLSGGAAAQRSAGGAKEGTKQAAANSLMGMSLQVCTAIVGNNCLI